MEDIGSSQEIPAQLLKKDTLTEHHIVSVDAIGEIPTKSSEKDKYLVTFDVDDAKNPLVCAISTSTLAELGY